MRNGVAWDPAHLRITQQRGTPGTALRLPFSSARNVTKFATLGFKAPLFGGTYARRSVRVPYTESTVDPCARKRRRGRLYGVPCRGETTTTGRKASRKALCKARSVQGWPADADDRRRRCRAPLLPSCFRAHVRLAYRRRAK